MNTSIEAAAIVPGAGKRAPVRVAHVIPMFALGMGLSVSLAITYVLCVLGYLFLPSLPIEHSARTLPARIHVVELARVFPGACRELWLGLVCGTGVRAALQFLRGPGMTTSTFHVGGLLSITASGDD